MKKIKISFYNILALLLLSIDVFFAFYDSSFVEARLFTALGLIIVFRKEIIDFIKKIKRKEN